MTRCLWDSNDSADSLKFRNFLEVLIRAFVAASNDTGTSSSIGVGRCLKMRQPVAKSDSLSQWVAVASTFRQFSLSRLAQPMALMLSVSRSVCRPAPGPLNHHTDHAGIVVENKEFLLATIGWQILPTRNTEIKPILGTQRGRKRVAKGTLSAPFPAHSLAAPLLMKRNQETPALFKPREDDLLHLHARE
jgi:hypothetical protein